MEQSNEKKESQEKEAEKAVEISTKNENFFSNSDSKKEESDGLTLDEISQEETKEKKIKNLIALVIFLGGLLVGSLFVDFIQLFLGSGYSERALKKTNIFESGDRTWVAFDEPAVVVKILTVKEDELANCPNCDPSEVLAWMKKFLPTLTIKDIPLDSEEGKALVEKFEIASLPAFVFDNKIKETEFYKQEGVDSVFQEKEDSFVLNSLLMGIPTGKFLKFPQAAENEPIFGNKDALRITLYSDFQDPYSKKLFTTLKNLIKNNYSDKVGLVLKDYPAKDIHPLSLQAALVANCAKQQGKFWETADLLFAKQDQWSKAKDEKILKTYFRQLSLDEKKMEECLTDQKNQEKIAGDISEAESYGLAGTPSGFIGQELFGGAQDEEEIKSLLDKQIK